MVEAVYVSAFGKFRMVTPGMRSHSVSNDSSHMLWPLQRDTASLAALQKATEKLSVAPLRGMPMPSGSHAVFQEDGRFEEQSRRRPQLRGVPGPAGSYKRFSMGGNQ